MVDIKVRIKYGEPNNWSGGNYDKSVIVLHETVTRETDDGAEKVAEWFADPSFNASTQYVIDNRDVIQCVPERAYAWSAGTTANRIGIHIELVSMATQTRQQWADPYSTAQLRLAADLVRELCRKHNIPPTRLGTAELKAGKSGITGHYNVSYAWRESTHEDVDPDEFPWSRFMRMVHDTPAQPIQSEEDDMALDEPLNAHDPKGNDITADVTVREALSTLVHYIHGGRREARRYLKRAQDSKAPR